MEKLKANDIIAIILIIGVFALHMFGHMEWHLTILLMVVSFYFGKEHFLPTDRE